MATAPKVKKGGYSAAEERKKRAAETFRISVKESDPPFSFEYQPGNIPVSVRAKVRDATGKTVEMLLFGALGRDVVTYADCWWISRLCAGEAVTRSEVHNEFDELFPGIDREDIEDVKVDHPEA